MTFMNKVDSREPEFNRTVPALQWGWRRVTSGDGEEVDALVVQDIMVAELGSSGPPRSEIREMSLYGLRKVDRGTSWASA